MPGKILKLPRTSLRAKLIIMNSLMIFFISLVYVLFSLSGEVADIQRRIEMNGTVTAQGIANAVAPYLLSGDDEFLSSVLKKAAADNNLVSAAFIDTRHRVVSHSNPGEEGKTLDEKELAQYIFYGKMAGIGDLLDREAIFRAASPVLRGSSADGYILLQYRSDEGFKTLKKMIFSTFFIAVFWCLIGAFFAVLYVNRITMPLMRLRDAVSGLGRGKFSTIQAASGGEVGELTEKFNEMVLALGEREREKESLLGELKALNESLNERVVQITSELRDAHSYLLNIISGIREGILTTGSDGGIKLMNSEAQKLFGSDDGGGSGKSLFDLFGGEEIRQGFEKAVSGSSRVKIETKFASNAVEKSLLVSIYPLFEKAAISGTVMIIEDQTEQKRIEEYMRRSDRLASLGTLTAGLSHELGNALNVINGYSSILLKELPQESRLRDDVNHIREEYSRAKKLLERFLLFAKPLKSQAASCDIREIVEDSLKIVELEIKKHSITVERHFRGSGTEADVDRQLITQVFLNLFINAIQAMNDGGRLSIEIGPDAENGGSGAVKVKVTDTGCGIPPENLEKIFTPFFTTKDPSKGTGLGLAIVHKIIEIHNGGINVQSAPGKGTTFTITLPGAVGAKS